MTSTLILGLDIGTSSVRATLYKESGELVPRSLVKLGHSFTRTPDGGSEYGAPEMAARVEQVIDSAIASFSRDREIEAVAVSSFWHSLLAVDSRGKAITPIYGWADTRSREFSAELKNRLDEAVVHQRTGAHFHSSFWPAKLLWLRRTRPGVWPAAERWVSFSDYLMERLCGFSKTSVSMASGTGIFDQTACDWDAELTRYIKIKPSKLPLMADRHEASMLKPTFARRWPRLRNAIWFPAIGDGAADHLGSCGLGKTKASLMVGTSAAMRVAYTGAPPKHLPDGLWCYRIDRDRVIIGGALSDGGNLFELLRKTLRVPKDAEAQMRHRGAAAHGLTILPFFHGERSTGYREDARGAIIGLSASHDAIDILQAGMESVAFRVAAIHDRQRSLCKIEHIAASGGPLKQPSVWPQIIADVLGLDLSLNSTPEAAIRGAVLLALESLGKIESIDSFSLPAYRTLAFHPECHAAYKKARKQHEEYYERTAKPT